MASQALIVNGLATALLLIALVLHILCLAMPHFSDANFDGFAQEMAAIAAKDPTALGMPADMSEEDRTRAIENLAGMGGGSVNFGMWKVCMHSQDENQLTFSLCVPWSTENKFRHMDGMITALEAEGWMRAVQAMSLIGMILLTVTLTMAVVNIVTKSKGDRLRLLYLFIAFFCVVSAIFIMISDIVMAANHKEAFNPSSLQQSEPPPRALYEMFKNRFSLDWSLYVDVLAIILTLISAVLHFAGGRIANSFSGIV